MVNPPVKVTLVSPEAIVPSVIAVLNEAPPFKSSALPPVAWPAATVALPVKLVLVEFKVLENTTPPTAVKLTDVGAAGALHDGG